MALFGKKNDDKTVGNATEAKPEETIKESVTSEDQKEMADASSFWANRKTTGNPEDVLRNARITEKTAILSGNKAYTFLVDPRYGKKEITRAFVSVYNKIPVKVNIVNVRGKRKKTRSGEGRSNHKKKAIVFLGGKDKIDFV